MACAKCPYYQPKESLADQLVEGKANLVRMLEFVQLTEDEKLLVTEGIELHQELIEKLVDVPTPAGPTPRELDTQRQKKIRRSLSRMFSAKGANSMSHEGEVRWPALLEPPNRSPVPSSLPEVSSPCCKSLPSAAAPRPRPLRCGLTFYRARRVKAAQEGGGLMVGARSSKRSGEP